MEISKILLVIIVFLITWKETLNQQITSNKQLDWKRNRRYYHESDHDDFVTRTETMKIMNESEKKILLPTASMIPLVKKVKSPQARSSSLNYSKQNPARKIISSRNIRLHPLNPKNKNILETHKPYVFYVKKNYLVDRHTDQHTEQNQVNDTLTLSSEEGKVVIKKTFEGKENSTTFSYPSSTPNHHDNNPVKLSAETVKIKPENSMIVKAKPDPNMESQNTIKNIQINEPILKTITPIKEIDESSSIEAEQELKTDMDNKGKNVEDSVVVSAVTNSKEANTAKSADKVVSNKVDKTKQRKHPFLDVIENGLHINIPRTKNKPNIDAKIKIEPSSDLFKTQVPNKTVTAFDLDSIQMVPQESDKCDEKENVVIRNNNYEEVLEISRSPQVLVLPQDSTVCDNIPNEPYYNDYQTAISNYQELPKPKDQEASNYPSNKQRVDQIDGATIVSYNNYYKLPTNYNSNSNGKTDFYPNLSTINNGNYGYQAPTKPYLSFDSNVWTKNTDFKNKPTNDVIKRIWRTWHNIEYDIKSKNVIKKLNSQQIYNLANQNDAENPKLIQRRYGIGSNYY